MNQLGIQVINFPRDSYLITVHIRKNLKGTLYIQHKSI